MAGGIFNSQNKVRPGAYINFKSVKKQEGSLDDRGISTLALKLGWGESNKIIEITHSDLIDGSLLAKLGFNEYEDAAQLVREALKHSYKLLVYRLNAGTKASVDAGTITITAKYAGNIGNDIKVAIKEITSKFEIIIYLKNSEVEKFTIETLEELVAINSNFVKFEGTGELEALASLALEGGEDGQVAQGAYDEYFKLIVKKKWDTMGLPLVDTTELKQKAVAFIKKCREEKGKKVQVVLKDYVQADYEGVISVNQGYKTAYETVGIDGFVAFMAGLTAGSRVNQSNTYFKIPGATEIINEVEDDFIEDELKKGCLLLSYNQDEKVIIEKDINTFTSFSEFKDSSFSKNRTIRTLDTIHNLARTKFENSFIGKIDNNSNGRDIFKSDICSDMQKLAAMGAIEEFKSEDIIISQGQDSESIVLDFSIKTVDAVEKLYMTVSLT